MKTERFGKDFGLDKVRYKSKERKVSLGGGFSNRRHTLNQDYSQQR